MPQFIISSYERAAHQALFGFQGQPADLVVSVLDPEAELPTDFVKAAASIGWDGIRHLRIDLYDTLDPARGQGGVDGSLFATLRKLATSIGETERVLVHCKGGISRSPAVVIALLAIRAGTDWFLVESTVTDFLRDNKTVAPNTLLVGETDRIMDYAGKLVRLIQKHRA